MCVCVVRYVSFINYSRCSVDIYIDCSCYAFFFCWCGIWISRLMVAVVVVVIGSSKEPMAILWIPHNRFVDGFSSISKALDVIPLCWMPWNFRSNYFNQPLILCFFCICSCAFLCFYVFNALLFTLFWILMLFTLFFLSFLFFGTFFATWLYECWVKHDFPLSNSNFFFDFFLPS